MRPLSLRFVSVVVVTASTLAMLLLLAWSLQSASSKALTNQIGSAMAGLADQVQDKIDLALNERVRDVSSIASLSAARADKDRSAMQALLDHAFNSGLGFEWIGLIDSNTGLIVEKGDTRFAAKAIQSPWVVQLMKPKINTQPLFRLLPPSPEDEFEALKDRWYFQLVAPIYGANGALEILAVGITNWDWASLTVHSTKQSQQSYNGTELIIVADDGRVLLGPAGHPASMAQTQLFNQTKKELSGWLVEPDANGVEYITGFSRAQTRQFIDGLGMTVLVRQSTANAMLPLVNLKKRSVWYMLLIALHATALQYVFSHSLAEPLLRMARAADDLRHNGSAEIPQLDEFLETKILSESLSSLVRELKNREVALTTLSSTLEAQVQERTRALEQKNELLAEANRKVEIATEAKSRFLAAASHDLRQPLQALNLFCVALKRRVSGAETVTIVDHLEQSLGSLGTMLDKLLHIARLDAGLVSPALEPLRLRHLIERIGAEFTIDADNRGLRFNFTCADCYVLTDCTLLENIVRNLVSNAFKFTRSGGVHLAARSRGASVVIEVYDTGPGIAEERQKSIFREFERGSEQAVGQNNGLGLGLSIVERYALLIDAQLAVRSVAGRGSRFSVEVPKAVMESSIAISAEVPKPNYSVVEVNIMLVDDNSQFLNALRLDLTDRGAVVTEFASAQEALSAVDAGLAVDVAIVDYDLGDNIKGVDLITRWRRECRNFSAIILTGRTDAITISELRSSSIVWITKPATPNTIVAAIENLMMAPLNGAQSEVSRQFGKLHNDNY